MNDKVNTAKINSVNTAKGNRVTSAVGEQGINAVKSSACWVWRPKIKTITVDTINDGEQQLIVIVDGQTIAITKAYVKEQLVFYKKNEVMLICTPTIDLSNSGLKEFQQPEFEGYKLKENKGVCVNSSNEIKKTTDAPIIEDWVSDCDEDESEVRILKSDNVQQKPKQANQPRNVSENPRNNRTNWNEKKTQKLRVGRNFVPTTVLTKSGIVPVSAAMPINTAAPKSFVNAAKTRPNAFQKVTSAVGEQGINVVKSSACWADTSLKLKGYLINNGYADLMKMLYDWS
ncbi:hypothetical protein Tco_1399143 [Tanacetum coccineum]